jgi:hypothetical protein
VSFVFWLGGFITGLACCNEFHNMVYMRYSILREGIELQFFTAGWMDTDGWGWLAKHVEAMGQVDHHQLGQSYMDTK